MWMSREGPMQVIAWSAVQQVVFYNSVGVLVLVSWVTFRELCLTAPPKLSLCICNPTYYFTAGWYVFIWLCERELNPSPHMRAWLAHLLW